MAKLSAGFLLFRRSGKAVEVLLVHPGGPFWAKKDAGSWSIPKGEYSDEDPLEAAKRELHEETGASVPEGGTCLDLGEIKQPSGKLIHAFACESDFNLKQFKSNTFEMDWPPRSGQKQSFPEADKAAWLTFDKAAQKIIKGQAPFLEALAEQLGQPKPDDAPTQATLF